MTNITKEMMMRWRVRSAVGLILAFIGAAGVQAQDTIFLSCTLTTSSYQVGTFAAGSVITFRVDAASWRRWDDVRGAFVEDYCANMLYGLSSHCSFNPRQFRASAADQELIASLEIDRRDGSLSYRVDYLSAPELGADVASGECRSVEEPRSGPTLF